jgi:hypothetical protein
MGRIAAAWARGATVCCRRHRPFGNADPTRSGGTAAHPVEWTRAPESFPANA